jgi:hypothetical protein
MKQQTAVEWLYSRMFEKSGRITKEEYDQAKEMEAIKDKKYNEMLEMLKELFENYKSGNEDNFIMSNLIDKSEQLIKEATEI